ncbi:MAG: cytochrome c oxidase subunit II [Gaiellales bacterium]
MSSSHTRKILIIWAVLSVIGVLAVIFGLGPHMPPGNVSTTASDQTETNIVISVIMTPIALGVITFFVYALFNFRSRDGDDSDGEYIKGDARIARGWIITTTTIVLALAIYGTYELLHTDQGIAGVGGGQGSTLIASAPANALDVQVIGQQWHFTYRYPQFGGVETFQLAIPVDRPIIFHVTSIDVIHSFWAYQLGVKADAVPGADNLAGTYAKHLGTFDIRCAELCGLWHGHMYQKGMILTQQAFGRWIARQRLTEGNQQLPPFARVYYPDPNRRAG